MSFVVFCVLGFLTIVFCLSVYYLIDITQVTISDAMKIITTQDIPDFIQKDEYLKKLLLKKLSCDHAHHISFMNLLYTYFSKNALLGDGRWDSLEDLCSVSLKKLPIEAIMDINCIIGIASGGAFIAPILGKLLSIDQSDIHYIHLSKWSASETNMSRLKLLKMKDEQADKQVIIKRWLPKTLDLSKKKCLLVDDQVCSGSTMRVAKNKINEDFAPLSIYTMALTSTKQRKNEFIDAIGCDSFIYIWPWGLDS